MDDTVVGLGKGSRVWYRHVERDKVGQERSSWLLAEIKDAADGSISIQLAPADEGVPGLLAGKSVEGLQDGAGALVPANPALQRAIADLTQLSYLNEPSILDNLTQRYKVDNIYTNAGPVLIAVNPCKNLPLYTDQVQHDYKGAQQH
jgi:myosin-5